MTLINRPGVKIKESAIPMKIIYNEGFDLLNRLDITKDRLKIKPVVLTYFKDYSK